MRKAFAILAVVALFGATTSCKKDYTCTCTITDSSGLIDPITSTTTINASKSDAETACNSESTIGTLTTKCSL